MAAKKAVTNEEILELLQQNMQMTSDGFLRLEGRMDKLEVRMDRLEARMDRLEERMDSVESRLSAVETIIREHSRDIQELKTIVENLANRHSAYISDISDILDRVTELEAQLPDISNEEVRELKALVEALVAWARKAAKTVNVPLGLPER